MVRAILDGTKTQTRRISKNVGKFGVKGCAYVSSGIARKAGVDGVCTCIEVKSQFGQPGDRLRVKEAAWMWCERRPNGKTPTGRQKWHYMPLKSAPVLYVANYPERPVMDIVSQETFNKWGWRFKVGRFLPKWASRITLEIISVRVERLQDISEADSIAEGVAHCELSGFEAYWNNYLFKTAHPRHGTELSDEEHRIRAMMSPARSYQSLWESINGHGSWDLNPWVWKIEFRRIQP